MTTLYIAEKPSLGRTIAQALGGGRPGQGQIRGRDWVVSWCIGHLYEQAMPEDYDPALKRWTRAALPICPEQWRLLPRPDYRDQIKVLKGLLREAAEVVHCGDPDREGQLLVDEVLRELGWRGPTRRAWLPDLTDAALQRALSHLKPNHDYQGLGDAALGRSHADWLVGMNLSRAMTIANRDAGGDALISIGRVQTPTLRLVVDRDRLIEGFVPKDFFVVLADFVQPGEMGEAAYTGQWQPGEAIADEEGRCLKAEAARQVTERVRGQPGEITAIQVSAKKEPPPLPFSLNELQQAASRRLGLSAQRTLDIAQALYERHKLTTYPRTDCRHLAANQHAEAPGVLAALARNGYAAEVQGANAQIRGRAFDDSRITAHTAIIPTANPMAAGQLDRDEAAVYDMVARTYLAQFYPDHRYQATQVATRCADESFLSKGRRVEEAGWRALFPRRSDEATDEPDLPTLHRGPVECRDSRMEARQTQPPPRYTEGTLIRAMANVARFVEDEALRKVLRENQGIGTEATRAGIIETLKKRGFLEGRGKAIQSTPLGRQVVDQAPGQLSSPAITAWWEQQLAEVEAGRCPLAQFEARAVNWVHRLLAAIDPARIREPMCGGGRGAGTERRPKGQKRPRRKGPRRPRAG